MPKKQRLGEAGGHCGDSAEQGRGGGIQFSHFHPILLLPCPLPHIQQSLFLRLRKHPVTCDRPHYLRSCKSEPTDPEAALRGPQALWPGFTLCQDCSQAQLRLLTAEPAFQGQELKPRGGPVTQLLRAAWARCLRGWGDKPSVCQGLPWF